MYIRPVEFDTQFPKEKKKTFNKKSAHRQTYKREVSTELCMQRE